MLDDEGEKGEWNTIGAVSNSGSNNTGGGGGRFSSLRSDNHTSGAAIGTSSSRPLPSQPSPSQPFHRAASTGSKPKKGGRSLADLAAGLSSSNNPPSHHVPHHGRHHEPTHERDPRSQPRSSSTGITRIRSESDAESLLGHVPSSPGEKSGGSVDPNAAKVIRYTREKLLSLRGRGDEGAPECVLELEGSVVVSKVSQDPGEFLMYCYFLLLLEQQELGGSLFVLPLDYQQQSVWVSPHPLRAAVQNKKFSFRLLGADG